MFFLWFNFLGASAISWNVYFLKQGGKYESRSYNFLLNETKTPYFLFELQEV